MVIQTPSRVTRAEFEEFIALPENADRVFELIHGRIVEKMPNQRHGLLIFILTGKIFVWWEEKGQPGVPGIEVRHGLPDDDENDYIPDLSYVSPERAEPIRERGAVPIMPDLAVEVLSPDDSLTETREKMKYYVENGTRLAWLFIPHKKIAEVYRPNKDVEILTAADDDILDGGDVLAGFTLKLALLF